MSAKHDRQKRALAKRRARLSNSVGRIDALLTTLSHNLTKIAEEANEQEAVEYDTPVKKAVVSSVQMKYVRHSKLGFITWPANDDLWHSMIGTCMLGNTSGSAHQGTLVSAGFVVIQNGLVACFGRSESLGLDSRADDSKLLAQQLGLSSGRL